jgi:hypothetical protein
MGGIAMNSIPLILFAILACFLAFKTLKNRKQKRHAHEALVNRVKRLRLYKMLQFLGADRDKFLRVIPSPDINLLIERCSSCDTLDICDRCLRDGYKVNSMSFCPNYRSLCQHSKTMYRQG